MHLRIRNISKTYSNGVQALKDVTLTIPARMYGLLGPNGAGKSTLMRMIATLQEPDEGSIRFGDMDVLNQKEEVRETLGYLPQEFGVYPKVIEAAHPDRARLCGFQAYLRIAEFRFYVVADGIRHVLYGRTGCIRTPEPPPKRLNLTHFPSRAVKQ